MASIHPRKKGSRKVYDVRWRDRSGANRSRTTGSKAGAEALAAEIEDALRAGRDWAPAEVREVPRLLSAAEGYLRDKSRTLAPRTLDRYATCLDLFHRHLAAEGLSDAGLDVLTKPRLRAFWDWLAAPQNARHGHPRSPQSCRQVVEVVQLLWAWAYEEEDYHEHTAPPRTLAMPKKHVRGVVVAPTWADSDRLLLALDPASWQRKAAVVARCTGLRRAEVLALRWSDLLANPPRLAIRGETTKGDGGARVVPVAPVLLAELATWPHEGERIVPAPEKELSARGHLDRDLRRAWKRSGAPEQVYASRPVHTLRKGFATGLRALGADPDAVKYLTGHALGGAGAHGAYLDAHQLPLVAAVALVPPLPKKEVSSDSRESTTSTHDQPELPRAR